MPTFMQQSMTLRTCQSPAARNVAQAAPLRGPSTALPPPHPAVESVHLPHLPAKDIIAHSLRPHQGTDDLGRLRQRRGGNTPAPQAGNQQHGTASI